jgi:light-regulated signal transduction histidine kinase (bacteriophytochrome)
MKLMIRDLLEYAKIDGKENEFTHSSLNEVCEIVLELIKDQVVANDAVITILTLPMIFGDKMQLVRLFKNPFKRLSFLGTNGNFLVFANSPIFV